MTSPFSFVVCPRVRQRAFVAAQNRAPLPLNNQSESARPRPVFHPRPLDDGQRMETRIRGADGNLALCTRPWVNVSRPGRRAVHIPAVKHKPLRLSARPSITGAVVSSIVNVKVSRGSCTVVS